MNIRGAFYFTLCCLLFITTQATAATSPHISELLWVDEGFLERQRERVAEITKMEFGAPLRKNLSDLRSLQRIVDNEFVTQVDTETQQALGVVLGDVFVAELGLRWVVYEDQRGKSRATCLGETGFCLFPVTMLSKRMKLGVKPDVQALFDKGKATLAPHQPRLPYSADK